EAAARPRQRDRSLDEQLVTVRVSVGLRRVDAGVACEADDLRDGRSRARPRVGFTGVGADHVPRRVADDGVEAGPRPPLAAGLEERLRKLELPVEQPMRV